MFNASGGQEGEATLEISPEFQGMTCLRQIINMLHDDINPCLLAQTNFSELSENLK